MILDKTQYWLLMIPIVGRVELQNTHSNYKFPNFEAILKIATITWRQVLSMLASASCTSSCLLFTYSADCEHLEIIYFTQERHKEPLSPEAERVLDRLIKLGKRDGML